MTQYRLTCGVRTWPWRDCRKAAIDDALEAGLATPDEHVDGRVYLDELVEVEERAE